jgi:hypothetical protein
MQLKTKFGAPDPTAGVGLIVDTLIAYGFRKALVSTTNQKLTSKGIGDTREVRELNSDLLAGRLAMEYPFDWEKMDVIYDDIKLEWIGFTFTHEIAVTKGTEEHPFVSEVVEEETDFEFRLTLDDFLEKIEGGYKRRCIIMLENPDIDR